MSLAVTYIGTTQNHNADISRQLLAAHALPGCDRSISCVEYEHQ